MDSEPGASLTGGATGSVVVDGTLKAVVVVPLPGPLTDSVYVPATRGPTVAEGAADVPPTPGPTTVCSTGQPVASRTWSSSAGNPDAPSALSVTVTVEPVVERTGSNGYV